MQDDAFRSEWTSFHFSTRKDNEQVNSLSKRNFNLTLISTMKLPIIEKGSKVEMAFFAVSIAFILYCAFLIFQLFSNYVLIPLCISLIILVPALVLRYRFNGNLWNSIIEIYCAISSGLLMLIFVAHIVTYDRVEATLGYMLIDGFESVAEEIETESDSGAIGYEIREKPVYPQTATALFFKHLMDIIHAWMIIGPLWLLHFLQKLKPKWAKSRHELKQEASR